MTAKECYRDLARAGKRRIAKFAENRRDILTPGYGEALIALQQNEDSEPEKSENASSGTQEEVEEHQPATAFPPQLLWVDRNNDMHEISQCDGTERMSEDESNAI